MTLPRDSSLELYRDLVDELRASRRVVGWQPKDDRGVLARLEDLFYELTPEEQKTVIEESWRGWPDLHDARLFTSAPSTNTTARRVWDSDSRQGDTLSNKVRTQNLSLLAYPTHEERSDEWVAYCLDLDLVTRGHSPTNALQKGQEAVLAHIQAEMASGLDPFRKSAPQRFWDRLRWVQSKGEYAPDAESRLRKFSDHGESLDGSGESIAMLGMQLVLMLSLPNPSVLDAPRPAWGLSMETADRERQLSTG